MLLLPACSMLGQILGEQQEQAAVTLATGVSLEQLFDASQLANLPAGIQHWFQADAAAKAILDYLAGNSTLRPVDISNGKASTLGSLSTFSWAHSCYPLPVCNSIELRERCHFLRWRRGARHPLGRYLWGGMND